jgi:hypothetical protein
MKKHNLLILMYFSNTLYAEDAIKCVEYPVSNSWFDKTQAYISESVCSSALWFDHFFANERDEAENVNRYIRLTTVAGYRKVEGFESNIRLSGRVEFPNFEKKLHLLLESERDKDAMDILSQGNQASHLLNKNNINKNNSVGLRWDVAQQPNSAFSMQVGLRFNKTINLRLQGRYRYTYPLEEDSLARLTQSVFWEAHEGIGENTRLDLEKLLAPQTLLRFSQELGVSEVSKGTEWLSELALFHHFTKDKAGALTFWLSGATKPADNISALEETGVSLRYRQSFYRPWLYFELEPHYRWVRKEFTHDYQSSPGIIARVEIQFGYKHE